MEFLKWNKKYSVKIKEFDDQHKVLVDIINKLYDAIEQNKGTDEIGKLIRRLRMYGAIHFATEEHYFDLFQYPETEEHKKIHKFFDDKMADVEKNYRNQSKEAALEMMHFLSEWLINHIQGTDKKYVEFLKERGLK